MPRLIRKLPSYRLHKPSGRAVVTLDGRDYYLGDFGTPESRDAYERLLAEWLADRRRRGVPAGSASATAPLANLTINELLLAFWRHAERHYRTPGGEPTRELDNYRDSIRPLKQLYGATLARRFSPLKLKALRATLIEAGLSRGTINQRVGRIIRIFKWGVSEELLPSEVYQSLRTVGGLQKGRTAAKESARVRPVPGAHVEAIRPHVSRQVWAMIELQRLSGMRPGEVTGLRTCDLDTSGPVWRYQPARHKAEHHGKGRSIFLGPRAQAILRPWLRTEPFAYLFQPREAMAEFRAEQRRNRRTPLYPSVLARPRVADPKQAAGLRYSTRSYYHAIRKACERGGVPPWHPHQLRHDAATRLRKEFGLDVARAVLGHSSPAVTEVYAELDAAKAAEAMEKVG
jgi:integrase